MCSVTSPAGKKKSFLCAKKKRKKKKLYKKINHHLYPTSILSSSGIPALRQPGQIQEKQQPCSADGNTQEQGCDRKPLWVLRPDQNGWDFIIKTHSVSETTLLLHNGVKGSREPESLTNKQIPPAKKQEMSYSGTWPCSFPEMHTEFFPSCQGLASA